MTILAAGKKIGDAHLIPAPVALTAHLHPPPVRTQPSAVQCPLKRENEEKRRISSIEWGKNWDISTK